MSGEMGTEKTEIPETVAMGGIVPHFYYDLLGRIIPGTCLLVAGGWLMQKVWAPPDWGKLSITEILIIVLAAYGVSFLIGPVSHFVFDRLCRFTQQDLTAEIASTLEKNHISRPAADGNRSFHDAYLAASQRCDYMLWVRAPQLAIIVSRWDAEAFTARQIGMVTFILFAAAIALVVAGHSPDHATIPFFLFLLIIDLSARQFCYSRRRAVLATFSMLASVPLQEAARGAGAQS